MKKLVLFLIVTLFAVSVVGCSGNDNKVVIGGKDFTEQEILVYLMEGVIEDKTDIDVETKTYLGGTNVVANAVEEGSLDIYAEYTGTALLSILNEKPEKDPEKVYDKVKKIYEKKKELTWLEPFGFNNTYTLAMKKERAKELGIENFSDLAKKSDNLVLGAPQEFLERSDGYKGLKKAYDMNFKSTKGMDPGLTYSAVRDGEVDVNAAFATDGRIPAFNLKVLKDDKGFFPPYYAAPVVRKDTLKKYPELKDALNSLAGKLDDKTMAELNSKVDLDKEDAKKVAQEWLKSQGLIK